MALEKQFDVVVVGGGLSGICAAIAAARCGVKVALVHDRPLLGGNASGELRIHIAGADCSGGATARYVRESGIIDEIRIENLKRNYADSHDVLSLICREFVEREPNIEMYLNTRARRVRMQSADRIEAVEADQTTSEKEVVFFGDMFIDCTGDGFIAAKAGAAFRYGREATSEFGESLAPEVADNKTLPSCVEFYLKNTGRPTPFTPPAYARRYDSQDDLPFRDVSRPSWEFGNLCGGFWWLSTGGDRNVINDNEEIYRDLLAVVMGLWDLMKNRGDFGAQDFALDWISPIPGKRESRRIEGNYILNQNDVESGRVFEDAVAYGGWPIDLHPPEGVFSDEPPNKSVRLTKPYTIPLRCLYSRSIKNLWMAGRSISVSHVALGTTRVMATCAVIGQAAGVAAAISCSSDLNNRQTAQSLTMQVQRTLQRQGAYLPFLDIDDPDNLARIATVTASTESPLEPPTDGEDSTPLSSQPFQIFPVSESRIERIGVMIESESDYEIMAGLRRVEDIWDVGSRSSDVVAAVRADTGKRWLDIPFNLNDVQPGLYLLWLRGPGHARWIASYETPLGLVRGEMSPSGDICAEEKQHVSARGCHVFAVTPRSHPYTADNITRGASRPEAWPNAWVSQPFTDQPQWVELRWSTPVRAREIRISFDGGYDSNITWPAPLGVFGCEALPAVAKDYSITVSFNDGSEREVISVQDNYQPYAVHSLDLTDIVSVRLNIGRTNGSAAAVVAGIWMS